MPSINPKEIEHFSKDSSHWWDENGPFKPLHALNPVRMSYIKAQICAHSGRNTTQLKALRGLSVLDIGCGGGLVCEPLARMGAAVTGIDADARAIDVATAHAALNNLTIDYRCKEAEKLTKQYDIVLALEILEHIDHPAAFVQTIARLAKPGGLVIFSTLNRTAKSFALGIVAAEYLLRWVPQGTHTWQKFIKPSELSQYARDAELNPTHAQGLIFNPLRNRFELSRDDVAVNYFLTAQKS